MVWQYNETLKDRQPVYIAMRVIRIICLIAWVSIIYYVLNIDVFESEFFAVFTIILIAVWAVLFFVNTINNRNIWYATTAFSYNYNNNCIYCYDINSDTFLKFTNLMKYKIYNHVTTKAALLVFIFTDKIKLKSLLNTIRYNNIIGSIVAGGMEDRVAVKIYRVTGIKKYEKYFQVYFTYINNGKEVECMRTVYDFINNYNELLALFEQRMSVTQNVCARCGAVMENGICQNCWYNVAAPDSRPTGRKYNIGMAVLAAVTILSCVLWYILSINMVLPSFINVIFLFLIMYEIMGFFILLKKKKDANIRK